MSNILGKSFEYSNAKLTDVVQRAAQKGFHTSGVSVVLNQNKNRLEVEKRINLDFPVVNPYQFVTKLNFYPSSSQNKDKDFDNIFELCDNLQEIHVSYEYLMNPNAKIYSYPRRLIMLKCLIEPLGFNSRYINPLQNAYDSYHEVGANGIKFTKSEMFNLSNNTELIFDLYGCRNYKLFFDIETSGSKTLTIIFQQRIEGYVTFTGLNYGNFEKITINAARNKIIFDLDLKLNGLIVNNAEQIHFQISPKENNIRPRESTRPTLICDYFLTDSGVDDASSVTSRIFVAPKISYPPKTGKVYINSLNYPRFRNYITLLDKRTVANLKEDLDRDVYAFEDVDADILYKRLNGHKVFFVVNYDDLIHLDD